MRSTFTRLTILAAVVSLTGCQSSGSNKFAMGNFWPWGKSAKPAEALASGPPAAWPVKPSATATPGATPTGGYNYAAAPAAAEVTYPETSTPYSGSQPYPVVASNQQQYVYPAGTNGYDARASAPGAQVGRYESGQYPAAGSYSAGSGQPEGAAPVDYMASVPNDGRDNPASYEGAPADDAAGNYNAPAADGRYTANQSNGGYRNTAESFPANQPSNEAAGQYQGDYKPGESDYQPGQTGYVPGDTGYLPPGVPAYQSPAGGYQSPATPAGDSNYRPGGTSDYQPKPRQNVASGEASPAILPEGTPGRLEASAGRYPANGSGARYARKQPAAAAPAPSANSGWGPYGDSNGQ